MNSFDRNWERRDLQEPPNCNISLVQERKPCLSHAGSRTPFQVLGRETAKVVGQGQWGPFILPSAREDAGQDPGLRSP